MTINGVNQTQKVVQSETPKMENDGSAVKPDSPNSVFEHKTKLAPEANLPEEIPAQAQEPEQMSRKEAKQWIKAYREQTGCSKKEAKAAFEQEFGYKMPRSEYGKRLLKGLRMALIGGNPIGLAVGLTHSAEERENFVETGKWEANT